MSRLSPIPRRGSRSSMRSNTTYHSFQEVEMFEPPMSSGTFATYAMTSSKPTSSNMSTEDFESTPMRRQDSGYESLPPRSSKRRASTTSSYNSNNSTPRPRNRPAVRRSPKSGPVSYMPRSSAQQLCRTRSHSAYTQHQLSQSPVTYFHFPAMPDPAEEADETPYSQQHPHSHQVRSVPTSLDYGARPIRPYSPTTPETPTSPSYPPLPPQTTHYWTSDRTRRLEYAAIDAASRGVRGWVMRHIVPDCFIPKSKKGQHLGFDDDGGSVRRYRLDLDEDDVLCHAEKNDSRKQKRWRLWGAATT